MTDSWDNFNDPQDEERREEAIRREMEERDRKADDQRDTDKGRQ